MMKVWKAKNWLSACGASEEAPRFAIWTASNLGGAQPIAMKNGSKKTLTGGVELSESVHGVELRDFKQQPLQVLSFGGGTQSSAMLLMVEKEMIPRPDIVIFSDTGSEEAYTLEHVHNVAKPYVENVLKLPFLIVQAKKPLHVAYREKRTIPVIGIRSCTMNFKVYPQRRAMRQIVGPQNGFLLAECWLGITTDEASRRVDESDVKWSRPIYPLLDTGEGFTRRECIELLQEAGWEVQKSGCWCCPYSRPSHWSKLKMRRPDLFQYAVEMEEELKQRFIEENLQRRKEGKRERNPDGIQFNRGGIRLKVIQEMSSLWSFSEDDEPEDDFSCDSAGGCFI